MVARVTTMKLKTEKQEEANAPVRDRIVPAAKSQPGFRGYLARKDYDSGESIVVTLWESAKARDNSDGGSPVYQQIMAMVAPYFATKAAVEPYEVFVFDQA